MYNMLTLSHPGGRRPSQLYRFAEKLKNPQNDHGRTTGGHGRKTMGDQRDTTGGHGRATDSGARDIRTRSLKKQYI